MLSMHIVWNPLKYPRAAEKGRGESDLVLILGVDCGQKHVAESAQTLAERREVLRQSMLTISRENNKTDQARLAAYEALEDAVVFTIICVTKPTTAS